MAKKSYFIDTLKELIFARFFSGKKKVSRELIFASRKFQKKKTASHI